jgi:P-type E1-E2 ATPase
MEDSGQTAAVVRIDGKAIALLGIADRTRPAVVAAVARITAVTGTAPLLLTGDNARAARRLAAQVGISDEHAGLPRDKVDAVKDLQAPGQRVLLVGGVGPGTGFAGHGPGRVNVRALQRPAC